MSWPEPIRANLNLPEPNQSHTSLTKGSKSQEKYPVPLFKLYYVHPNTPGDPNKTPMPHMIPQNRPQHLAQYGSWKENIS